jgi:hypothetical protein
MVNPIADMNGNRFLARCLSCGIARCGERGERLGLGAWIGVVAIRGDMKVKREGMPCESKGHDARKGL